MKKAQGISINTIIIAAIALIVLVVLIAIFAGRMGIFGKDLTIAQEGIECRSDDDTLVIVEGNSCTAADEKYLLTGVSNKFSQYIGIVKKCGEGETDPEGKGCIKPGRICCTRKV